LNYGGQKMKFAGAILFSLLVLILISGSAFGWGNYLTNFNNTYPGSQSGRNASCQLCHGQSTSTWNAYGWELRSNGVNFSAAEGLDSDGDPTGATNLDEINASTQPGWTPGSNNAIYPGPLLGQNPPAGISGDLDPAPANQPPVADPNGPYSGDVGMPVPFDGSGSSDPDGTIVSYDWDFGDGNTVTGMNPTHTYAASGTYTVTLTVTDDAGATDTASTTANISAPANQPPVADPNGPYSGDVGVPVPFDGSGSSDPDGTIVSYDWDFGDGNTGTGMNPTHTYAASGIYTVTLTVTDDAGATDTATTRANISAPANQPPVADPNGPYSGDVGVPVPFDGSGSSDPDGTIVSYDWDFGDGNTVTGMNPTHTYAATGTYTVTLTVTDDGGATDTASTTASISGPRALGDLDIARFSVSKRAPLSKERTIKIKLVVKNTGTSDVTGPATVTGMQNGVEVYNETMEVSDPPGNGRTAFDFPTYTPTDTGDIMWTATIADDNPDDDTATAVTTVPR
jgi:PKD repeat protein